MLAIFTDLDGTLLDAANYSFAAANSALSEIRRRAIPLVLCTSKTRAEVEPLRSRLEIDWPYIVENGGAVYFPTHHFPAPPAAVVRLAAHYQEMVSALAQACALSGVRARGFDQMTVEEVARQTGLEIEEAARAKTREHDEPFVIEAGEPGRLLKAIERLGKHWSRGGRFYHIHDGVDKGTAVQLVSDYFSRHVDTLLTLGLGDAPNDIPLLNACDRQVIVGRRFEKEMSASLPEALITSHEGPAGWNKAVLEIISQLDAEAATRAGGSVIG